MDDVVTYGPQKNQKERSHGSPSIRDKYKAFNTINYDQFTDKSSFSNDLAQLDSTEHPGPCAQGFGQHSHFTVSGSP